MVPVLIDPVILIEYKLNTGVAMEIILTPNSAAAGIVGDNLFMVEIFGTIDPDGTEAQIAIVSTSSCNLCACVCVCVCVCVYVSVSQPWTHMTVDLLTMDWS